MGWLVTAFLISYVTMKALQPMKASSLRLSGIHDLKQLRKPPQARSSACVRTDFGIETASSRR
jgi:hypothetical protein